MTPNKLLRNVLFIFCWLVHSYTLAYSIKPSNRTYYFDY